MGYFIAESENEEVGCHTHATAPHGAVHSCTQGCATYNISNGSAISSTDSSAQQGTDSLTNAAAPTAITSLATTRLAARHDPTYFCSDTVTHAGSTRCHNASASPRQPEFATK